MSWIDESINKAAAQLGQRESGIATMRQVLSGFVSEQATKYVDAGATVDEAFILVDGMIERIDKETLSDVERELMEHYLELWYDDVSGVEDVDV